MSDIYWVCDCRLLPVPLLHLKSQTEEVVSSSEDNLPDLSTLLKAAQRQTCNIILVTTILKQARWRRLVILQMELTYEYDMR